jgi:hypothetical protein
MAIELAKARCDVSAVCLAGRHPLLKTRVVREVFPYNAFRPVDSLAAALRAADPHVVVPCDDRAVQHLHQLHARARTTPGGSKIVELIERSLGAPGSFPIVSSRYHLLEVARQEGLPVPETQQVQNAADLRSWGQRHALPWVLKADRTWGGGGVEIARTLRHAERFFDQIPWFFGTTLAVKRLIANRDPFWLLPSWKRWIPGVIVQSHIEGRPANCAVVCWEGRILSGIAAEVVSSDKPTGPANVVRIIDHPEMMRCAEILARRLRLSGFFGLDFMIEESTGRSYLIEMNPRCTPLCHLRLGQGRDMMGALYAQLSGQPIDQAACVTHNDTIAYFPEAWHKNIGALRTSFRDIPYTEPDLIEELLHSSPPGTLFARATKAVRAYMGTF